MNIIWGTPARAERVLLDYKLDGEVNELDRRPAIQFPNGLIIAETDDGIDVYSGAICTGMCGGQALYIVDLDAEDCSEYGGSIIELIAEVAL